MKNLFPNVKNRRLLGSCRSNILPSIMTLTFDRHVGESSGYGESDSVEVVEGQK